MALKIIEIFITLTLNVIHCAYTDHILPCNVTVFEPCPGNNQICNETSHRCDCVNGFVWVGDDCEIPSREETPSHGATTAVIIIFTLALITCGLVLVIRKYNLIEYIRQKISSRRNNDVMYEDVMIGQDDPPLSP